MTVQLGVTVNGVKISTDFFVQGFIDHTVSGMIEALEGTAKIKELNLSIDGDNVTIVLNGAEVTINAFVSKIIKNTVSGLVSSLKGVSEVNKLNIKVKR